jgi:hypothetical protein
VLAERFAAGIVCLAAAAVGQTTPAEIARAFAPHDVDGDGVVEIRTLEVVAEKGAAPAPLVAIVVEGRLWRATESAPALRERLARFGDDLANEGSRSLMVAADVHDGPPHQDGRTVLGLRRLLQRLHARAPLTAVVFVGHFPDALLVRTCNWRRNEPLQLPGKDQRPVAIDAKTTNVRCVPEIVAHRCDLVLADLDGDWERVYVPGPAALPSVTAVFGDNVPDAGGPATAMQVGELRVVDAFHVRDGAAVVDGDAFTVRLDAADRDHECTADDRALGNPLARPEIAVSRLDARGVAASPDRDALDAAGRPRAVAAGGKKAIAWQPDAALELQLLVEYLDRNHAFRTTPMPKERHKPAAFGHELGAGFDSLRAAAPAWREFAEAGYDVHERADLVQLTRWLQRPAVLRILRVHSDPWGGMCAATDPAALAMTAGVAWHWSLAADRLVPSWGAHKNGRADFAFYRSLWQHQLLPEQPFLLVHTGCEALSPPGAVEHSFDHAAYGQRAHAESLLFFTPCLAIVGRAKVFYDEPRGFSEALGAGATFGTAWQRYFAIESTAANWGEVGDDIGRKRTYFWSVVGDCTLRLPKAQ